MPFQVVYSVYQVVPKGAVFDFTAGDDISAICSTQITLEATIYGDPQGHRFLWEQISGSDVTWDTPQTELSVTVSFTNYDDKKFRFWIDKGSNTEQYDDVWVWGTPTNQETHSPGTTSFDHVSLSLYGGCKKLDCSKIMVITNLFSEPVESFAECNSTNFSFRFTTPDCDASRVVRYEIQEKVSEDHYQKVDKVLPDPDGLHFYLGDILDVDKTYRIVPTYQLNYHNPQFDYLYASCDIVMSEHTPRIDGNDLIRHQPGASTLQNININNYNVIKRTKIERQGTDDLRLLGTGSESNINISSFSVRKRALIQETQTDSMRGTLVSSTDNTNITNFNIEPRDSTQIGG